MAVMSNTNTFLVVGLALGPGEATLFFTAAGAGGKGLYSTPNGGGAVTTLRAFANPANGAVLDTLYEYRGLALMPTISSCPAGTWMTGSAAAPFAIICTINCAPGFSAPLGASLASQCVACTPGSYSPLGLGCATCPAGQYSTTSGATSCSNCTAGTAGPAGSTSAAQCVACTPGTFAIGGTACNPCPAGSYSTGSSATTCASCAAGSSCPAGASSAAQCASCAAGTYSTGGTACIGCPANTYVAANRDQRPEGVCEIFRSEALLPLPPIPTLATPHPNPPLDCALQLRHRRLRRQFTQHVRRLLCWHLRARGRRLVLAAHVGLGLHAGQPRGAAPR